MNPLDAGVENVVVWGGRISLVAAQGPRGPSHLSQGVPIRFWEAGAQVQIVRYSTRAPARPHREAVAPHELVAEHETLVWVARTQLSELNWAPADIPTVERLVADTKAS